MARYPIFLSTVCVMRNQAGIEARVVSELVDAMASLTSDYELIIVDNASSDDSLLVLKGLTSENGLPNLQVYALTKEVDADTASWVGLENALGDFVVVVDPFVDDIAFLPQMLDQAISGADVVFASNLQKPRLGIAYRVAFSVFNGLYKWFNGIHLAKEAPQYRVLSKRVINFLLQHPKPSIIYRYLPASGGFAKANLTYSALPKLSPVKHLSDGIDRGMQLLFTTTHAPMRVVTSLSLFGAFANIFYSLYVVAIGLFKADVQPGWVSLSLQQSGMFFLITLVLLVLGEYILNMASLSNEGPTYHVGQEFTSARMTRREKLNIEEANTMAWEMEPPGDVRLTG